MLRITRRKGDLKGVGTDLRILDAVDCARRGKVDDAGAAADGGEDGVRVEEVDLEEAKAVGGAREASQVRCLGLVPCGSLGKRKVKEEAEKGAVPTKAHDGAVDGVAAVEEETDDP